MDRIQVIETADGSHSLLNTELGETYHSTHGALQESKHVFIAQGLEEAMKGHRRGSLRILEVGFGTGLNALLTLQTVRKNGWDVSYTTLEKFPLPVSIVTQLNYSALLDDVASFRALHDAPWETETQVAPGFLLSKKQTDLVREIPGGEFDLVYYDAFAPSKQPEMWTTDTLRKVTDRLSPGGIWVSYCAKGQVKRDLSALGLEVETLPGPPGKKEMTRARRPIKTT